MIVINIYGFGSFFNSNKPTAGDIDLLLKYKTYNTKQLEFVLHCKTMLLNYSNKFDIVMLSDSEEKQMQFLRRSNATFISQITNINTAQQIQILVKKIINKCVNPRLGVQF